MTNDKLDNSAMPTNLHGKVAVITGAGSGLGFATASYFIQQGAHVALLDINAEQGQQAMQDLASEFAAFFAVDVTDETQIDSTLATIVKQFGQIDICINCAGIAPAKRILDKSGKAQPLSLFKHVIDINLIGSFNVAKSVAELMAKNPIDSQQQRGVIINTASIAGYEGQVGQTAYAASKAGLIGLCLAMARDLAAHGIRVNTIAPGIMATPMLLAMPQPVQDALAETVVQPQRLGNPLEFAQLAQHICVNAYLNGETIRLDGGLRMAPK